MTSANQDRLPMIGQVPIPGSCLGHAYYLNYQVGRERCDAGMS